jgi:hypothetical protein
MPLTSPEAQANEQSERRDDLDRGCEERGQEDQQGQPCHMVLVESPDSTRHSRGNCVPVHVHGYEWKHIGQHKHLGACQGQRQWTVDRGVTRKGNDSAAAPAQCPALRCAMRVLLQKVALRTGE